MASEDMKMVAKFIENLVSLDQSRREPYQVRGKDGTLYELQAHLNDREGQFMVAVTTPLEDSNYYETFSFKMI